MIEDLGVDVNSLTCSQRYDLWLFNTAGATRKEKSENHLRAHRRVSEKCLFAYRATVLLICLIHVPIFWYNWITNETGLHFPLVYITNWAYYSTIFFFGLSCVAHIRHTVLERPIPEDSSQIFVLWKWC